eukprot:2658622-Pyramimonas_sp.AAC.1
MQLETAFKAWPHDPLAHGRGGAYHITEVLGPAPGEDNGVSSPVDEEIIADPLKVLNHKSEFGLQYWGPDDLPRRAPRGPVARRLPPACFR